MRVLCAFRSPDTIIDRIIFNLDLAPATYGFDAGVPLEVRTLCDSLRRYVGLAVESGYFLAGLQQLATEVSGELSPSARRGRGSSSVVSTLHLGAISSIRLAELGLFVEQRRGGGRRGRSLVGEELDEQEEGWKLLQDGLILTSVCIGVFAGLPVAFYYAREDRSGVKVKTTKDAGGLYGYHSFAVGGEMPRESSLWSRVMSGPWSAVPVSVRGKY